MVQRLDQLLQSCTVKITISGQTGWGTGFFVAPGLILTCAHVVKALNLGASAQIAWQQEGFAEAAIAERIPEFDLALLQFSPPQNTNLPCVYLDREFQPTDNFYTYGYPDSFPDGASVTSQCEGDARENGVPLILFKSGLIRPGFSGSPLLNLRTGKVCGIVKFTRDRSIDLGGGAIPTGAILQQFEALTQQQQAFHQQDARWSSLLPALTAEFATVSGILERIEAATATQGDLEILRRALQNQTQQAIQLGKYNINIGEISEGQDIQIGNRTYVEINNKAVQAIVEAIQQAPSPAQPRVWMVPANRNPFFTGRETLLVEMRASLMASQPTAFCGLGGMGKTQMAIEYAYRHQADYEAVLWVGAEQAGEFSAGLVEVAKALELPIAQERDETIIVSAVKAWLKQHQNWLLVLDNADDLTVVQSFLRGIDTGHILLTSRAQATGAIKRIEIQQMPPEEGALFLLRRAKVIGEQEDLSAAAAEARTLAVNIATQMDGLPLALDQAGAFIEETFTSLEDYLAFYEAEGVKLLAERGELADDHPSVTVTFSLAFEKVSERNLAAADLIRACAFLAPDAIPEELFREAAAEMGEHLSALSEQPLELTKVLAEASRFSLLYRNAANRTFSIHRLVQCVLQAQMSSDECRLWAERIVRSLNQVFPKPDHPNWSLCDRLLPHARVAVALVDPYQLQFESASDLLNKTARYLFARGQYFEAESLFLNALALRQNLLGAEHLDVAESLNNLAEVYLLQGRYSEAEPLILQALELRKRLLGDDHSDVAISLNNWAYLFWSQGDYSKARSILLQVSDLYKRLEKEHPDVAANLNNLAKIYEEQGQYIEAKTLFFKALELQKRLLGDQHLDVASSLKNLAELYRKQGRYSEAEPLLLQSLELYRQLLGNEHPDIATSLNALATLYWNQGRYDEAEPIFLQALSLYKRLLGDQHLFVAINLNNLANLYLNQGSYDQAEPLFLQALELYKQLLGEEHTDFTRTLNNLAYLYWKQERYSEAEPIFLRALELQKQLLGNHHPDIATSFDNLAKLYGSQERYSEAEPLFSRALELRKQLLGSHHPDIAISLHNIGVLYRNQGRYGEAESFFLQSLALDKQLLGDEHPDIAVILDNLAVLKQQQGYYNEAEKLFLQALDLDSQLLGDKHFHTIRVQNNLERLRQEIAEQQRSP